MSQSTTISPSPASRKPVALSRNDPFSMPVIHCLGLFLGMTASSLSVSILMARSSSVTRTHLGSFEGGARTDPPPASARNRPDDSKATKDLESLMRLLKDQQGMSTGYAREGIDRHRDVRQARRCSHGRVEDDLDG